MRKQIIRDFAGHKVCLLEEGGAKYGPVDAKPLNERIRCMLNIVRAYLH